MLRGCLVQSLVKKQITCRYNFLDSLQSRSVLNSSSKEEPSMKIKLYAVIVCEKDLRKPCVVAGKMRASTSKESKIRK